MKTFGLFAVTYDPAKPDDFGQLTLAGGKNFGDQRGLDAINYMAQHDIVALWHWVPEEVIQALHNLKTRVLFAHAPAHVPTFAWWDLNREYIRNATTKVANYRIRSKKKNTFGEPWIDVYETASADNTKFPHCWAMDIFDDSYRVAYGKLMDNILDAHYAQAPPDGHFIDVHNGRLYWGSATNAQDQPVDAKAAWDAWDRMFEGKWGPVWGHTGMRDAGPWNIVDEWCFRDNSDVAIWGLANELYQEGRWLAVCPNGGNTEVTRMNKMRALGIPAVYQMSRSGFWEAW